jgi:hypothetical protein
MKLGSLEIQAGLVLQQYQTPTIHVDINISITGDGVVETSKFKHSETDM